MRAVVSTMDIAEATEARIERLLASIDYKPPPKSYEYLSHSEAEREQLRKCNLILRLVEYDIPDYLPYEGITSLVQLDAKSPYDVSLRMSEASTPGEVIAMRWMSDNYNTAECRWLLALAHMRLALSRPGHSVVIRDYHGSSDGIIMIDSILKDISDYYPYLRKRIVYSRDSFRFAPSFEDEDMTF